MRFYGFAARCYLIRENLEIGREAAVLEIGAGSTAAGIAGRVHKFWGVDVSKEMVAMLREAFAGAGVGAAACGDAGKRIGPEADADMSPDTGADADVNARTTAASIKFICGDAAGDLNLGKKFDVIYSADTLEHVERPQGFFDFIGRHLAAEGAALVTFPNESAERHHGQTWFAAEEELREMAGRAGLAIIALDEVRKTLPHRVIRAVLWDFPEAVVSAVASSAASIAASSPAVLTSMRLGKNASKLPKLRDQRKISACPEGRRSAAESGRRRGLHFCLRAY